MNKQDIEFCPYCQTVLYVDDISEREGSEEDDFEIHCDFCQGIYRIIEMMPSPLTKEELRMKFQGIPLKEKKPRGKRKGKAKK